MVYFNKIDARSSAEGDEPKNRSARDFGNPLEFLKSNSNHKQSYFTGRPGLLRPS
jgi:hypothetical protein